VPRGKPRFYEDLGFVLMYPLTLLVPNLLQNPENLLHRFRVLYEDFFPSLGQALDPAFQLQRRFMAAGMHGEDELKRPPPLQVPRGLRPRLLMLGETPVHIGGCPRVEGAIPAPDHIYIPTLHITLPLIGETHS